MDVHAYAYVRTCLCVHVHTQTHACMHSARNKDQKLVGHFLKIRYFMGYWLLSHSKCMGNLADQNGFWSAKCWNWSENGQWPTVISSTACTCTHIHTCTHTHIHTHNYVDIHVHIATYIHALSYKCTYSYAHTQLHTHAHMHTHTHIYTCMHVHTYTHVRTYCTHIHTCAHTYTHAHIHTRTRSYTNTHILKHTNEHTSEYASVQYGAMFNTSGNDRYSSFLYTKWSPMTNLLMCKTNTGGKCLINTCLLTGLSL